MENSKPRTKRRVIKVPCLECGAEVEKYNFRNHVVQQHIPGKHFSCMLCFYTTKYKQQLKFHLKNKHDATPTNWNYECHLKNELLEDVLNRCFPFPNIPYQSRHCKTCDQDISLSNVREHVSRVHLKKVMRRCRLCPYTSSHLYQGNIKKHMEEIHRVQISSENVDSSEFEKNKLKISSLVEEHFD